MRGALKPDTFALIRLRIIPAYAGSTVLCLQIWLVARDHPRVCGEHENRVVDNSGSEGSSPRMRGARAGIRVTNSQPGIIPAYAGSTSFLVFIIFMIEDHPRVCGEHIGMSLSVLMVQGSSPRMRGARPSGTPPNRKRGIIPAYAGSTQVWSNQQN